MSWIALALFSHVSWGTANIIDKYIISNRVKNVFVFFVIADIIGLLSLGIIPFINFSIPTWETLRWILLAGVAYTIGIILYFKALEIEEVSRINIWWNLIPLFTLLLAWITIGEKLTGLQLMAMTFLISGAVVGGIHFGQRKKINLKALGLIMLACLESSVYAVIIRKTSETVSFQVLFVLISIIKLVVSLIFFAFKNFRAEFSATIKNMNLSLAGVILCATVIDYLGILFNQWALSRGPAALVFSLEGFQGLFVVGASTVIARYQPRFLNESSDRPNVTIKIIAAILMIIGVIILTNN